MTNYAQKVSRTLFLHGIAFFPIDKMNKVDGPLNGYFFQLPHFSWDMKQAINTRWLQLQSWVVPTFFMIFEAHMNILFIISVEILLLVNDRICLPNHVDY